MSLVVKLGQRRTVWMLCLEVHVVTFRIWCRISTLLTDVYFVPSLLVGVIMSNSMDLESMGLQRASLGKGLVTVIAFVWTDSSMSSSVSLEVKGIIESFATEGTQVALDIRMTLEVSIE